MLLVSDVNQPVQKRAGGDHERSARDIAVLELQPGDLSLIRPDSPARLKSQVRFGCALVCPPSAPCLLVGLSTR